MYVPLPEFDDLAQYNQNTLEACEQKIRTKIHYILRVSAGELFEEDRAALLPLPEKPLDLSTLMTYRTNETGMFMTDGGHWYSTSPELARQSVNVRLTSSAVIVLKDDYHTALITHRRLYGSNCKQSIHWGPYLRAMSRKPRSFLNSGLRELLPDELVLYLSEISNHDRGQILEVMADLYDLKGFEAVKTLCLKAAVTGTIDPVHFRRLSVQMFGSLSEKYNEAFISGDFELSALDRILAAATQKRRNDE